MDARLRPPWDAKHAKNTVPELGFVKLPLVSKRAFDRKFGEERIAQLPMSPGVYLFKDAEEKVVYVGKAKNLRRRLSQYRNAGRRKVHRKMRLIVREAMSLHVETLADEQAALLLRIMHQQGEALHRLIQQSPQHTRRSPLV